MVIWSGRRSIITSPLLLFPLRNHDYYKVATRRILFNYYYNYCYSTSVNVAVKVESIGLRPYQEECIEKCLEELRAGLRRQAVSLPVGSGKTVVFANLINKLPNPKPEMSKVLVLAHREELLTQAARQINRFCPHLKVGIEQGDKKCDPAKFDVIIASVMTLGRKSSEGRLRKFDPSHFKAIIIDEAHHSVADSYIRIVEYFGIKPLNKTTEEDLDEEGEVEVEVEKSKEEETANKIQTLPSGSAPDPTSSILNENSDILIWGCSATLSRNDERELGSLFEKIIYHLDISQLIKEGWLCEPEFIEVHTDVDLQKVHFKLGDFDQKELSLAIDTPTRNELVAATWFEKAFKEYNRKATIVFTLNIAHAYNLACEFEKLNVKTAVITGDTSEELRRRTLEDFSQGKIQILLNCAVLTEGTDLPITDCVVMTRPTCNSNLYTQMVGRGLRKHSEKEYCLVIDFVDRYRSKKRTLVNFPSLLPAKKPIESIGESIEEEERVRERAKYGELNLDNISVVIRNLGRSAMKTGMPGHGLAWFSVDEFHLGLSCRDSIYLLEINPEKTSSGKISKVLKEMSDFGKERRRINLHTESFNEEWQPVYELLPKFIKYLKKDEGSFDSLTVDSFWRRKRPPSHGQIRYIMRILTTINNVRLTDINEIPRWSMGRISDLISKHMLRQKLLRKPIIDFEDFVAGVEDYN